MWEIDLVMEEVDEGREAFGDVGEHVGNCFIDASPVGAAIDPLAILGVVGEMKGCSCVVPAEVGKFCTVAEPVIDQCILGREVSPGRAGLVWNGRRQCGNAVQVESVEVAWFGGD
jgi:hypothetical protein